MKFALVTQGMLSVKVMMFCLPSILEFSEGIMKDIEKGDPGPNSLQKFLKVLRKLSCHRLKGNIINKNQIKYEKQPKNNWSVLAVEGIPLMGTLQRACARIYSI